MKTPIRLTLFGLCATSLLCLQTVRADDTTPPPPGAPAGEHGPRLPPGFNQLNLSDAQKEQIMQILKDSKDKIDAVLTADQKAQLEQLKAQHHEHGAGGPPPPAQ